MEHRCLAHTRHFPGRLDTLNKCPLRNKWTLVEHILPVKMGTPDAYYRSSNSRTSIRVEFDGDTLLSPVSLIVGRMCLVCLLSCGSIGLLSLLNS
jgi:hypothetical protein